MVISFNLDKKAIKGHILILICHYINERLITPTVSFWKNLIKFEILEGICLESFDFYSKENDFYNYIMINPPKPRYFRSLE